MQDKSQNDLLTSALMPGATIFVASVCVMMLELVAGRLAARQFGSSLYTWTSVIGVTLAGLTVGNYTGGRLADVLSPRRVIGWLLGVSSAFCAASIALNTLAGEWSFLWRLGLGARAFGHIAIVFFIPSTLLGAVCTSAVKMSLESIQHRGRTVGRMYALGAAGSILGTFLTGFWLIAAIGTANTLWLIAGVTLLGAVIYLPKSRAMWVFAAFMVFLLVVGTIPAGWAQGIGSAMLLRPGPESNVLYETESQYSYIAVRQITKEPDERRFVQDNMESHSRIIMGNIRDLRLFYTQVYAAVTHRTADDKKTLSTLFIGGGGYVFPRYILDVWPGSRVEVAEIDPAVTKAAIDAFGLPADAPIHTVNLDGRNYVDQLLERKSRGGEAPQYDFVYTDAFSDVSVPYQLVTKQFNEKIYAILAADGVYMVNMIDMLDTAKFLGGLVNTLKLTFPYVYVVKKPSPNDLPANFILIAAKRPVNLENLNTERLLENASAWVFDDNDVASLVRRTGGITLDDDYVPVENFMAPVVRQASAVITANRYLGQAMRMEAGGDWEKAVEAYRQAAQVCPAWSAEAYYTIGLILSDRGKVEDAINALRTALAQGEARGEKDLLPLIHYNVGMILKKLGRGSEASKHFSSAINLLQWESAANGGSAETLSRLGQVQAASNNMRDATLSFEQALKKDSDNITHHLALIEAYAFQGRLEDAKRQLNESIRYMLGQGRNEDVSWLENLGRRIEAEKSKK